MGRKRTGSIWRDVRTDLVYARLTWVDTKGRRREVKRRAVDEEHARHLCQELLQAQADGKRFQPNRRIRYNRTNVLIYCVQILDGGICPIKIGTTNDIGKRVKMFLTHTPYEIKVLATWGGDVGDEKALHSMFATSRITREWFRPTPELLKYIEIKARIAA